MAASGTSRGPRSDQQRNDRLILEAAARVLAADPAASMQAVADAAGVARLTVYRRFPTRDALAAGLRAAVEDDALRALAEFAGWDGPDALRGLVATMTGIVRRFPVALSRPVPSGPGVPAGSVVDERIVTLLREGQRASRVRTDLPAELLNATLFGILAACYRVSPDADLETASEQACRLAAGALGTGAAQPG